MIKIYTSDMSTGSFKEIKKIQTGVWIDITNPTQEDVQKLTSKIDMDAEFINYILDDEEQPRIDSGLDKKLIIIDVPVIKPKRKNSIITTAPMAILIIRDDYIITVSKEEEVLKDFRENKVKDFYTFQKSRFTIQILYRVATLYLK